MTLSLRSDGRSPHELRPLSTDFSSTSKADAGSEFTFGPVTVQGSFSGPLEVRQRDEQLGQATLQVHISPLRGLSNVSQKASAATISSLLSPLLHLHSHPRSLIQITLQTTSLPTTRYSKPFTTFTAFSEPLDVDNEEAEVLDWASCVHQAALLNAALLACIQSGISMNGTAAAVGLARSSQGQWLLDPSPQEEVDSDLCLVIGFAFGTTFGGQEGQMLWCETVKAKSGFDQEVVSSHSSSY